MAGYFGTESQKRLQAEAEANAAFIAATPGACQSGRMVGCDDPDLFGWERIEDALRRDGVCGFRLVSSSKVDEITSRLAELDCRFDTWDIFLADRSAALAACSEVLARPLPDGLVELGRPYEPEGELTERIQALIASAGIVPFSGSLLTGACGPAITVAVGDGMGNIVAAAHGYLPHNAHSPFRRYAWGGLVAVAEEARGKGLGTFINARIIADVFGELDTTHVYELISATNLPSRRMVEACGLRLERSLVGGAATLTGSARYTR